MGHIISGNRNNIPIMSSRGVVVFRGFCRGSLCFRGVPPPPLPPLPLGAGGIGSPCAGCVCWLSLRSPSPPAPPPPWGGGNSNLYNQIFCGAVAVWLSGMGGWSVGGACGNGSGGLRPPVLKLPPAPPPALPPSFSHITPIMPRYQNYLYICIVYVCIV